MSAPKSKVNGVLESPKAQKTIFSFVTPAESEKITYSVNQQQLCSALQRNYWFHNGTVIKTLEKGGVSDVFLTEGEPSAREIMFPVMHYVNVPSNQAENTVQLLNSNSLGKTFTLQQGLYTQIKQFRPFPENELLDDEENSFRAYIILGFKTLENTFNETLEEMWKDWTGARSIYLNLPDELGLSQVTFYRRSVPKGPAMFMYILIVQCENVNKKNGWMLLDYVQRLRVEKMMGYMSAYRKVDITDEDSIFSPTISHLNTMDEILAMASDFCKRDSKKPPIKARRSKGLDVNPFESQRELTNNLADILLEELELTIF